MHGVIEYVWYGRDARARLARAALAPLSWTYARLAERRNARFDDDPRLSSEPPVPALSVGNLSVGGTGKTPIAAWAAGELLTRGARPAVVLRGYGDDEPLVHQRLNPGVPIVVRGNRTAGIADAAAEGADCVVLDDAFQHRQVRRIADWVLVAAERWPLGAVLPAGPLREPEDGLRRATLVVVTRKAARAERADAVIETLQRLHPELRLASCHLAVDGLVDAATDERAPLAMVAGQPVLAVASIGDPHSFFAQLASLGVSPTPRRFPDHHRFTRREAALLAAEGRRYRAVVCTLKDAVKLTPLWPRAAVPLWYVSQAVLPERGLSSLHASLDDVLAARARAASHAG